MPEERLEELLDRFQRTADEIWRKRGVKGFDIRERVLRENDARLCA